MTFPAVELPISEKTLLKRISTVSLAPKTLSSIVLCAALALLSGCAHHRTAPAMTDEIEIEPTELPPPILPGERVVTSTGPTTGRYADTQPAAYPRTRIIVRVADHGVIRRQFGLSSCPRPSGDVLAGPYYWESEDRAYRRPNWVN